jgi:hypothetical protein
MYSVMLHVLFYYLWLVLIPVACLALLNYAVACERTFAVNPEDVEKISEDDFVYDGTDRPAERLLVPVHVKLSRIIWYSRWCAA